MLARVQHPGIIIYTEVFYGSGDFFAAKKLIQQLEANDQHVTLTWIIYHPRQRKDVSDRVQQACSEFSDRVTTIILQEGQKIDKQQISRCDLILFYPTIHYLELFNFQLLQQYHVPIIQMHEHDAIDLDHQLIFKSEVIPVNTGFSGLGLNFESVTQNESLLSSIYTDMQPYQREHELLFSYLNNDGSSVVNHVNFTNYLTIALGLVDATRSVDVICNTPLLHANADIKSLAIARGFNQLITIEKNNDDDVKMHVSDLQVVAKRAAAKTLRVINPFPVSHPVMLAVIAAAHPFMQVTGDQSLGEVLSVANNGRGVFPFYQCMHWKRALIENWISYAEGCLGNASPYVKLLKVTALSEEWEISQFSKDWCHHEASILEDSRKLFTVLHSERNLKINHLRFIKLCLQLKDNYTAVEFKHCCQLLVQLIVKLSSDDEVCTVLERISRIEGGDERCHIMAAFVEMLCLNQARFTLATLLAIVADLQALDKQKRMHAAMTVRKISNLITPAARDKYAHCMLPELQKISTGLYYAVVEHVKSVRTPEVFAESFAWFQHGVAAQFKRDEKWYSEYIRENSILLAVTVYEGYGDIIKFINVYQSLTKMQPAMRIYGLVHCTERQRAVILAMMRESRIPMRDMYVCAFSLIEWAILTKGVDTESLLNNKYIETSFYRSEHHALYISVATPFPSINRQLRTYGHAVIPYLDIAEVEYVSYSGIERQSVDHHHHLVAMGLSDNAIGLDITQLPGRTNDEILAMLPAALRKQLLGNRDSQSFLNETILMPAYVKNDRGLMSLYFLLSAMTHIYSAKQHAVLWMPALTCELHSPLTKQRLREAGVAEVVICQTVGTVNEQRITIEHSLGKKQLRILTSRLSPPTFDMLYQLAVNMGGFIGCAGQNSFEKALSFNALPAFCAPGWQIPILCQTQSVINKLFANSSPEYQVLMRYIEVLTYISASLFEESQLMKEKSILPYQAQLAGCTHKEMLQSLNEIFPDFGSKVSDYLFYMSQDDAFTMVGEFFANCDFTLLLKAWRVVCGYLQDNKNMHTWLHQQVEELLSTVNVSQCEDKGNYAVMADIMQSNLYLELGNENLSHTYRLLTSLVNEVRGESGDFPVNLIITNGVTRLVNVAPGLEHLTIVFSIDALLKLSIPEIRFGLRLCLAFMSCYAIENAAFSMQDINRKQIFDQLQGDLVAGIAFCRFFVAKLTELKGEKWVLKLHAEFYSECEFYQDLIKLIEVKLAEQHKNELHHNQVIREERPPMVVQQEVMDLQARWLEAEKVEVPDTLTAINRMLALMPSLRIRNVGEYCKPTLPARRLLAQLDALPVNLNDVSVWVAFEQLINAAYKNRVAIFTNVYRKICKKLFGPDVMPPLGPYQFIISLINDFADASSQAEAEQCAARLLTVLNSDDYANMFNNHGAWLIYIEDKSKTIDQQLHSSIGARIKWSQYVPTVSSEPERYNRHRQWALASVNQDIAIVLFRLGAVDDRSLWLKLNHSKIILNVSSRNALFFDDVPDIYKSKHNSIYAPSLDRAFYKAFYKYLYNKPTVLLVGVISVQTLEKFITDNLPTLALPEFFLDSIRQLIQYFNDFLAINHLEAEQFIWRFYCDKSYQHGMAGIMAFRKTLSYYITGYDIGCTGLDKIYTSASTIPYLSFIIDNPPKYIPIHDMLDALENFGFVHSHWPVSYFFNMLGMRVDHLADAVRVARAIRESKPLLRTHKAESCLSRAICHTYIVAAEQATNVLLFSKAFYDFYQEAVSKDEVIKILWEKNHFKQQLSLPSPLIEITTMQMAQLYADFDTNVSWPDSSERDLFSTLLLKRIEAADKDMQLPACAQLLFKIMPLTDMAFALKIIDIWSTLVADAIGKDDRTHEYYKVIAPYVVLIIDDTPSLYCKHILEALMVKIDAQDRVCDFIAELFINANKKNRKHAESAADILINAARKLAEHHAEMDMVEFLTQELSQQSIQRLIHRMDYHAKKALTEGYQSDKLDKQKTEIVVRLFYYNFWNQPIEVRALVINNLLISSYETTTSAKAAAAYQRAFNYIINNLFPVDDEESRLSIALLLSYLQASNEHVRPFLLAAVITANKMSSGNSHHIATTLPKLAEALGAAGVKAGQAAHSFPKTPAHIRSGLAYLKSQARLPYRWELWQLLKAALPNDVFNKMALVRKLLGGASFYVAAEVQMTSGEMLVIRLLRESAHAEVKHGFAHLNATLQLCRHHGVMNIARDLTFIIRQAEAGANIEIDHHSAKRQYELAAKMYDGSCQRIVIGDSTYLIRSEAVRLFASGPGYQLISKADGIEFNTLKESEGDLSKAVAMAICRLELEKMLSGSPCDFDRHGAQMRITYRETLPNVFAVTIVNYDFGEVLPELPTREQLQHCQNFMNQVAQTIFSSRNLVMMGMSGFSAADMAEQLAQQMLQYLYEHADEPDHDLLRLRGIFKGMLALNDFMQVAAEVPAFLKSINALFVRYTQSPSYLSRFMNWIAPADDVERSPRPGLDI